MNRPQQDDLPARMAAYMAANKLLEDVSHLLIAVSGGADSLALLVALAELRARGQLPGIALRVATLDHGIRGRLGAEDAQFVQAETARLGIPCTVGRIDVPLVAAERQIGIEDAARQMRYAFLSRTAAAWAAEDRTFDIEAAHASQPTCVAVATAHHQEDQAETVLMHLLRGTGMVGLRGMLPRSDLTESAESAESAHNPFGTDDADQIGAIGTKKVRLRLIRPLLGTPKAAIDAFIGARRLQPRIDATNADTHYLRNRLRLELLPLLRTYNPAIAEALTHTAETIQADYAALHALIPPYPYRLDEFRSLPRAVQRMALRARPEWRKDVGFADIERALDYALAGKPGRVAIASALTLCVGFDRLILSSDPTAALPIDAPALPPGYAIDWTEALAVGPVSAVVGEGWSIDVETFILMDPGVQKSASETETSADPMPLRASSEKSTDRADHQFIIKIQVPIDGRIGLRTWRIGERFRPAGMGGHRQLLSDLWTNAHVPALWRPTIPLFTVNDEAAAFIAPTPDGLLVRLWEPPSNLSFSPSEGPRKLCIISFQHSRRYLQNRVR